MAASLGHAEMQEGESKPEGLHACMPRATYKFPFMVYNDFDSAMPEIWSRVCLFHTSNIYIYISNLDFHLLLLH